MNALPEFKKTAFRKEIAASPSAGGLTAIPPDSFHRPDSSPKGALKVLDLFAGAGGFSLGFEFAGMHVKAAIEIDAWACETLKLNHHRTEIHQRDITSAEDTEIKHIGRGCDVIIGGPPCQGFSVANKSAGDPDDPRNSLFREFLRAIDILRPRAILLENVPGLLSRRTKSKKLVIDIILEELQTLGYRVDFQILHAQAYGVPQIRPRLFVLGFYGDLQPFFPEATHGDISDTTDLFTHHGAPKLPYVSLWDAISDLPIVDAREGADVMQYVSEPANDYQNLVRAGSKMLFNHVAMNHSRRLVERFSHVRWGESGMHAPSEHQARKRGDYSVISGKTYSQNNRRMHPGKPCHTIPASFYANFIHPFRHRNFTPREGARIQSFPDWYKFLGKPTVVSTKLLSREERVDELHLCQYNQIGNAVPPLVAFHLAKHLQHLLS